MSSLVDKVHTPESTDLSPKPHKPQHPKPRASQPSGKILTEVPPTSFAKNLPAHRTHFTTTSALAKISLSREKEKESPPLAAELR